jgi:hypothetical protein
MQKIYPGQLHSILQFPLFQLFACALILLLRLAFSLF